MSYSKLKQYAKKFSKDYWGDCVHDVWLRYFEKHGVDLFKEDKPKNWLYKAVKWEFLNSIQKDKMYGLKLGLDEEGLLYDLAYTNDPLIHDNLIYVELDRFMKQKIKMFVSLHGAVHGDLEVRCEKHLAVYELMKFNYRTEEIARHLGVSMAQISYYKKQIREAINHMAYSNPFTGSKVKVKKAVTEAQWDKRKDNEDFDLEDYNEYYKLFIHKESGEGWLVRLKEEKTNPYIK